MKRYLYLLVFISLVGCATKIQFDTYNSRKFIESKIVEDKNYVINIENTAYVGQPIIKVKDYVVNTYSTNKMVASSDFKIIPLAGELGIGSSSDEYDVIGSLTLEGQSFTAIDFKYVNQYLDIALLIDSNGKPYKKLLNTNIVFGKDMTFEPEDLTFSYIEKDEINASEGYQNYEIIYSGSDDEKIYLTYREFTQDNLAKPSFYQDLTYSKNSSNIRFRDLQIRIGSATNEYIKYSVTND